MSKKYRNRRDPIDWEGIIYASLFPIIAIGAVVGMIINATR